MSQHSPKISARRTGDGEFAVFEIKEIEIARFQNGDDADQFVLMKSDALQRNDREDAPQVPDTPESNVTAQVRESLKPLVRAALDAMDTEPDTGPVLGDVPAADKKEARVIARTHPRPVPNLINPVEGAKLVKPDEARDPEPVRTYKPADTGPSGPHKAKATKDVAKGSSEFTEAELKAAFKRLEAGEKCSTVAQQMGKEWTSLRSHWARRHIGERKDFPRKMTCMAHDCKTKFTSSGPGHRLCLFHRRKQNETVNGIPV